MSQTIRHYLDQCPLVAIIRGVMPEFDNGWHRSCWPDIRRNSGVLIRHERACFA